MAACQAGADNTRENQMLVYAELKKGTPPVKILELLKQHEAARKPENQIERRQFGIVAIPDGKEITPQNNRVGFNGANNSVSSLYFGGRVGDIHYQVQGNTLLGDAVVHQAALAFTRATGTMADRVMAAMEAADRTAATIAATAATTCSSSCRATTRPRTSPTSPLPRKTMRWALPTTTGSTRSISASPTTTR